MPYISDSTLLSRSTLTLDTFLASGNLDFASHTQEIPKELETACCSNVIRDYYCRRNLSNIQVSYCWWTVWIFQCMLNSNKSLSLSRIFVLSIKSWFKKDAIYRKAFQHHKIILATGFLKKSLYVNKVLLWAAEGGD